MSDTLRDQLLGLGFKAAPKPERKPERKPDARRDGGAFVHEGLEQGNHRKPCDHQPDDED